MDQDIKSKSLDDHLLDMHTALQDANLLLDEARIAYLELVEALKVIRHCRECTVCASIAENVLERVQK